MNKRHKGKEDGRRMERKEKALEGKGDIKMDGKGGSEDVY